MHIESKRIDKANAEAKGMIFSKDIKTKEVKIIKHLSKTQNIAGFRKGKIPAAVIKSRFKKAIDQGAQDEALQDFLKISLDQIENPDLLGDPIVKKMQAKDDDFEVEIQMAIKPSIELGDYKSLVPKPKIAEIDKTELTERIQELALTSVDPKVVQESRTLESGDFAKIDFKGFIEGKAFEGGAAEDYQLHIGKKQFIEGFEEALIGMQKDEAKDIELTFPENYHDKNLAGKPVKFNVKLKDIMVKSLPTLDDKLAQKLLKKDNAIFDDLEKEVTNLIKNEKTSKLFNEKLKPELLTLLSKHFAGIDLPQIILEQEINNMLNEKLRQEDEAISKIKKDGKKLEELKNNLKPEASLRVVGTLVIHEIAKLEKLEVNQEELAMYFQNEAMQSGIDPKHLIDIYKKNNLLPAIQMHILQDKVLNKLLQDKLAS